IYGHARTKAKVQWSFTQTPRAAREARREARNDEPELPLGRCGLRAVGTFDHDDVGVGRGLPDLDIGLILRRVVAIERGLIAREFDHHIARAAGGVPAR